MRIFAHDIQNAPLVKLTLSPRGGILRVRAEHSLEHGSWIDLRRIGTVALLHDMLLL